MTMPVKTRRCSVEEYLRLEAQSPEKHEYWDGVVVNLSQLIGMAGGTFEHSLITTNFTRALGNRLTNSPCRVMSSDLRVKLPQSRHYLYPDSSIVCQPPQFDPVAGGRTTLLNPRIVVEVISPSTETYDRGKKLLKYIQIPASEEVIFVAQSYPRIDSYFRHPDGSWTFSVAWELDASIRLRSLSVELPLREVYAGVEFPPDPDEGQSPS
jgi:Uma2 family endonuclease